MGAASYRRGISPSLEGPKGPVNKSLQSAQITKGCRQETSLIKRSGIPTGKGSYRGSKGAQFPGFLRSFVSGEESVGRLATSVEPHFVESFPLYTKVQNGDLLVDQRVDPPKRLGNITRSSGCILSYSNSHIRPKMTAL